MILLLMFGVMEMIMKVIIIIMDNIIMEMEMKIIIIVMTMIIQNIYYPIATQLRIHTENEKQLEGPNWLINDFTLIIRPNDDIKQRHLI